VMAWGDAELRLELGLHGSPLAELRETAHEWWLGTLAIHKQQALFRSGYGHTLAAEAQFRKQAFTLDGVDRIAIIFHAFDRGDPAEYFAGWVPRDRERDAERWIAFLNGEIAKRLGNDAAAGASDDAHERAAYDAELDHFERTRAIAPSKFVK
jgi:hypothetical protein